MAQQLKVDYAAMTNAAKQIGVAVGEGNGLERAVSGHIDHLSTVWTGKASGNYVTGLREWQREFGNVMAALDRMRETLQKSISTYTSSEDDIAATATSGTAGGGGAYPDLSR